MADILTDLSPTVMAAAIKSNLYAFFRSLSSSKLVEFSEDSKAARWLTQIPHPWFNGVLVKQPAGSDEESFISDFMSYFKSRQVSSCSLWTEPDVQVDGWRRRLEPHGFQHSSEPPGMAINLAELPESLPQPAHFEIREVQDLANLEVWTRTFRLGYEMPETMAGDYYQIMASLGLDLPFRYYLGILDETPVSAVSLFLGAGVAGIYSMATIAQARGRGIGSLMTRYPLLQAAEMGYRAGVLQSSEMGFGVYRRLGFRKLCNVEHFYHG
jgi:ribosomal protein S18 acetylase RimI-like enzyme